MKMYCRKCGSGSEYSAKAPSFCSSCGNPMNASAARMGKMPDPEPEEADEVEECSQSLPSISQLEVETEVYAKSYKMGEVAGSRKGSIGEFPRDVPNEGEKQTLMDSFWDEAGKNQTQRDL